MNEICELVKNMKSSCFFCSMPIQGKKTQEHIIPNTLLGKLGIKEEKIIGKGSFQYSRVKVPAHGTCNSSFGSAYENEVTNLLSDTEKLYEEIRSEENGIPIIYSPSFSTTTIISTWLSKIYYGLFYNDFLKIDDYEYRESIKRIINSENFRIIQNSYRDGVGFCLPSSLYVFKSNCDYFDLRTLVFPKTILIKVRQLTMILCIEDGFLTKGYLNDGVLKYLRETLAMEEKNNKDFPSHLLALSEILALRYCIPKSPSFIYSDRAITNMSFSSLVQTPNQYYKVDSKQIAKIRNELFDDLVFRTKETSE